MELERDRTDSRYSEITPITAEEKGGIKSAAGLHDSFFELRAETKTANKRDASTDMQLKPVIRYSGRAGADGCTATSEGGKWVYLQI